MDTTTAITDRISQEQTAKKRFESFTMSGRAPQPTPTSQSTHQPSHGRSHSRATSISSSLSSLSLTSSNSDASLTSKKRPASHHHRRSSVSTRHESAEMMGVSIPELAPSLSDDNINFGEKDSIRRRALWALEGKPDVITFAKVEIPDLGIPVVDSSRPSELPSRPSFPPGFGISSSNALLGKRDSFGKLLLAPSSSSSDQLGTLLEEDEEESEDADLLLRSDQVESTLRPVSPDPIATRSASPPRHRPATLNLRPLSLASSTFPTVVVAPGSLPTPLTPSNQRPAPAGLKSLTLTPSPSSSVTSFFSPTMTTPNNNMNMTTTTNTTAMRRNSLILTPSPSPPILPPARRPSPNSSRRSPSPEPTSDAVRAKRQSSILYKRSSDPDPSASLPTPDATPTVERKLSMSSTGSGVQDDDRPLSANENTFLHHSHAMLLARITDLERALASSRRSSNVQSARSFSSSSDISSAVSFSAEPSDEMLRLVADLKAERDELKHDVDGWRMRVGDMEKHLSLLGRRVEAERREAWVARERLGLLEVEKSELETSIEEQMNLVEDFKEKCEILQAECTSIKVECEKLKEEVAQGKQAMYDCPRLRDALAKETAAKEELERALEGAGLLDTPRPRSVGVMNMVASGTGIRKMAFRSVDSVGSSTDVESLVDSMFDRRSFKLKAVAEEDEEDTDPPHRRNNSDDTDEVATDDDELARYEDEDDDDMSFRSPSRTNSSLSSMNAMDFPHSVESSGRSNSPSSPTPPPEVVTPKHEKQASLSKTWSFPKGSQVGTSSVRREPETVDHFFGCLEDVDGSPPAPTIPLVRDLADNGVFSRGFGFEVEDDDELPPFLLPLQVGQEVPDSEVTGLDIVMEEDEDDMEECGEVVEGGIRLIVPTLLAPPKLPSPLTRKPAPVYESFYEEDDDAEPTFAFPQSKQNVEQVAFTSTTRVNAPVLTTLQEEATVVFSTPFKSTSGVGGFVTPPNKRSIAPPSFIPQPKFPTPPRSTTTPIPQALRKPVNSISPKMPLNARNSNSPTFIPQPKFSTLSHLHSPRQCAPRQRK